MLLPLPLLLCIHLELQAVAGRLSHTRTAVPCGRIREVQLRCSSAVQGVHLDALRQPSADANANASWTACTDKLYVSCAGCARGKIRRVFIIRYICKVVPLKQEAGKAGEAGK